MKFIALMLCFLILVFCDFQQRYLICLPVGLNYSKIYPTSIDRKPILLRAMAILEFLGSF